MIAILDIDGTLVDTNYQHSLAWYRAFRARGIVLPVWRIHRHIGMGGDQLVSALCGEDVDRDKGDDIRDAEKQRYMELIDEVETMEGSRELIEELKARGHTVVFASSAKEDEVDHYLGEIARVLAPDGRCFASYYLLTRESRARMHSKESVMRFNHDRGSHWIVSAKVPELSVGYDDSFLTDLYAKHGLSGERYLGHWCGQPSHWSSTSNFGEQDVIVARKTLLPHDMAGRSGSALVGG